MERVPGSLGDAGFHRESQDDAHRHPNLEEKPLPPPQILPRTPAGRAAKQDPPDERPAARAAGSSTKNPAQNQGATSKKKTRAAREKLRAPDAEPEDLIMTKATWTQSKLEVAYRRIVLQAFLRDHPVMQILQQLLTEGLTGPGQAPSLTMNKLEAATDLLRLAQEAGLAVCAFAATDLFSLELDTIRLAAAALFNKLKPIVGEKEAEEHTPTNCVKESQPPTPGYHTGSSTYESATSEVESNSSTEPKRMPLIPAGIELLRNRSAARPAQVPTRPTTRSPEVDPPHESTSALE
ncbi:hypothetical protein PHYSODRAFT_260502 [Phytophthora sojae]|uniref:Uncharacterized protein n=1 Tax=Phytophthora sojae (strain P6497) TaxID=1094619 RepID=G4YIU5_PHYSP|nr:hypothetical protein PHYSODRAFT_260502 [Phytophthora sojae]EGZ28515.1 hypothetical protein PHYSODRAFT_260502 [Phytophthora sojae]|eukprot:XP_009515790.1 hypothetical protein PHYSODRAFT_260502 [Phytophthora sojae]